MKQKNLILLVVAVGIGLAAAFLTAQLGAKSGPSQPETEKIVVVKQEMPVGTLIQESRIDKLVELRDVPKGTTPPEAFRTLEQVTNKRLTRTMRTGDRVLPSDITDGRAIAIPEGKVQYAIPMDAVRAVAGFALPGSEVDIILTQTLASGKKVSQMILRKMLVVAVDILDHTPEGNKPAVPKLSSISVAVTPREAMYLAVQQKSGEMTLALRDREDQDVSKVDPVWIIPDSQKDEPLPVLTDPLENVAPTTSPEAVETVLLPVPRVDLEPGTLITPQTAEEYFQTGKFVDVPTNAIRDLSEYYGQYLVKPVAMNQFVPTTSLALELPKEAEPELPPEPAPPARKYHTLRIYDGGQPKQATYELTEDGRARMTDSSSGKRSGATRAEPGPRVIVPDLPKLPEPRASKPRPQNQDENEDAVEPADPLEG